MENRLLRSQSDISSYRERLEVDKDWSHEYIEELVEKYSQATQFLIIAGTREFNDWQTFYLAVNDWFDKHDPEYQKTIILSGMANGPDTMGYLLAEDRGIPYEEYEPDWDTYGRMFAGKVRNGQMASRATHLLAFWDRMSTGTSDMIKKSTQIGLHKTIVYYLDKNVKKNVLW